LTYGGVGVTEQAVLFKQSARPFRDHAALQHRGVELKQFFVGDKHEAIAARQRGRNGFIRSGRHPCFDLIDCSDCKWVDAPEGKRVSGISVVRLVSFQDNAD
jgi:hypothetical protein